MKGKESSASALLKQLRENDMNVPFLRKSKDIDSKAFPKATEEYICRQMDKKINLSLLVAKPHNHVRIVDYRLGQYKLKCSMFDELAAKQKIKKVFTIVEKQDSHSWRTVGFSKEAVIPGYFRNADAYIMSRMYDEKGAPVSGGIAKLAHEKGSEFAEPDPPYKKPNGLKIEIIDDPDKIASIINSSKIHDTYHTFSKGVPLPHLIIEGKVSRKNFWVASEINNAFGHAKIDVLSVPSAEKDSKYLTWLLFVLMEELAVEYDVASVFSFSSVNDDKIGQIFVDAGFRTMGQLSKHMAYKDGEWSDTYVWHRKIYAGNIKPSFASR